MPRFCLLVLVSTFLPFAASRAATPPETPSPSSSPPQASLPQPAPSFTQPDLLSLGAAYVGFDKFDTPLTQGGESRTRATDFRLEYRWGYSIYSAQDGDWFNFRIHPLAGGEASTRQQLYGFGGLGFDLLFWKHLVFTQTEAVGLFDSGHAKPLGSFIEFRSQAELGWRFDNDVRVTAFIAHISNAGLTQRNPGEEMAGGYIHVPVGMLFGQ